MGVTKLARLGNLALSIPAGIAIFYAVARLLKVEELEMAVRSVAGPVARRLGRGKAKPE
jgi:hypothetical protein